MNVKHFRVRVSGEHLQNDQNAINQFLNEVTVQKTATNFIAGMIDYWSVLVFYEPKIYANFKFGFGALDSMPLPQ